MDGPDGPPFTRGQRILVVNPRPSLKAKVGDTAIVTDCKIYSPTVGWVVDLVWEGGVVGCRVGCYAYQFTGAGGPW